MPRRARGAWAMTAVLLGTLGFASASRAAADPAAVCSAAKRKALGKNAFDQMKCEAIAARKGIIEAACLQKADGRLSGAFTRAEQKGGCLTVGDTAALAAQVDGFVAGAVMALPAGGPSPTTTTSTTLPLPCAGGEQVLDRVGIPRCWYVGAPEASCDQVCVAVGRVYDPVTATFAGSGGDDVDCFVVLAAFRPYLISSFGPDVVNGLFVRSQDCTVGGLGGLGCFARPPIPLITPPGYGRCATPPTTSTGSAPGHARACACQ